MGERSKIVGTLIKFGDKILIHLAIYEPSLFPFHSIYLSLSEPREEQTHRYWILNWIMFFKSDISIIFAQRNEYKGVCLFYLLYILRDINNFCFTARGNATIFIALLPVYLH